MVLIIAHLLTELHSLVYALNPKTAETEVDLFLSPSFQFKLSIQWYLKMMFDDVLVVVLCFLLANAWKNYSRALYWIATIYAYYHIIDLYLFYWNYKRTVAVYWFMGLAAAIAIIILCIRKLYGPKGGKVRSMI